MPPSVRDSRTRAALALACLATLAFAQLAFAAMPASPLVVGWRKLNGNLNDDTQKFEGLVIRQQPGTLISSDNAIGIGISQDYDNSRWNLAGKVHIEYDGAVLDADRATVVFVNRQVKSIDVQGAPAKFSRPGKIAGQPYRGTADAIAYDGPRRQVRFTGNAWFSFGPNEGTSATPLVYDIGQQLVWNEKAAPGGSATGVTINERLRPGAQAAMRFDFAFDEWKYDLGAGSLVAKGFSMRQGDGRLLTADNATGTGVGESYENSRWVLTGKVHIEHDGSVLDADSANVAFANRMMKSADVRGAPATFMYPGSAPERTFRGSAQAIAYDNARRQARFTGHIGFEMGASEGSSEMPIIYDIDKGTYRPERVAGAPPISVTVRGKPKVPPPRTPDRSTAK
jgi:lipopolysaccharide export system protein LptA